eukprot:CAMPEP_0201537076 /NCGR_PEP_ID=MMETSP0161_2-20130828/63732_1 /ASSEMBLY_ACC=CAM_ASM_000251 /TAXON_ID=180227 /ORGANISM="Neoparamoeba aestuarina, Strain SoJaBio B1-5/56/2" /LENGTH=78 /DNA_ID=CAMNT_0047943169 /DNA_START=50 /DNA_END=283 /DNA_ORIENTATION=-
MADPYDDGDNHQHYFHQNPTNFPPTNYPPSEERFPGYPSLDREQYDDDPNHGYLDRGRNEFSEYYRRGDDYGSDEEDQ